MAETVAENQRSRPGFEGYLNERVISIPEVLPAAGYETLMACKWHLGLLEAHSPKPGDSSDLLHCLMVAEDI